MSNDLPYYEKMYGIYIDDWEWSYGSFIGIHHTLTKEYINEGCSTGDWTVLDDPTFTNTVYFLYPHWIKKQYYIEGVVEGHFTLSCLNDDETIVSYEIKLMTMNSLSTATQIGTTGSITVTKTLTWDAVLGVGDEIVFPFFIDISTEKKVLDGERIYVEITIVTTDVNGILYHSNDATWEDFMINIPLRGL
jgi:hypothetical protein